MFYERQTILLLAAFWRFLTIFVYAENFFFFTVKCKMNKKLQLRVLHKGPLARISCHWIQHCWGSLASSFRYPRNVSKGNELCFDLRNCHLRHFFFISRFCITSERKTSSIFDEFTFFVYAVEFVGLAMLNLIEILFFHIGKKALFARVHWMWLCRIIRLSGGKKSKHKNNFSIEECAQLDCCRVRLEQDVKASKKRAALTFNPALVTEKNSQTT